MGEMGGRKLQQTAPDLKERINQAKSKGWRKSRFARKIIGSMLRGRHFPPKPGDSEGGRYEIALGVSATPAGLKVAIAKGQRHRQCPVVGEIRLGTLSQRGPESHLKP